MKILRGSLKYEKDEFKISQVKHRKKSLILSRSWIEENKKGATLRSRLSC